MRNPERLRCSHVRRCHAGTCHATGHSRCSPRCPRPVEAEADPAAPRDGTGYGYVNPPATAPPPAAYRRSDSSDSSHTATHNSRPAVPGPRRMTLPSSATTGAARSSTGLMTQCCPSASSSFSPCGVNDWNTAFCRGESQARYPTPALCWARSSAESVVFHPSAAVGSSARAAGLLAATGYCRCCCSPFGSRGYCR